MSTRIPSSRCIISIGAGRSRASATRTTLGSGGATTVEKRDLPQYLSPSGGSILPRARRSTVLRNRGYWVGKIWEKYCTAQHSTALRSARHQLRLKSPKFHFTHLRCLQRVSLLWLRLQRKNSTLSNLPSCHRARQSGSHNMSSFDGRISRSR